MSSRTVTHTWLGPKAAGWINARPTLWAAVCSCRWVGPERATKQQARADHMTHVRTES